MEPDPERRVMRDLPLRRLFRAVSRRVFAEVGRAVADRVATP